LGISLKIIAIVALKLDFSIQRPFIWNSIIGFIFQLILGFNPAPQPITYGDTSFSIFTSADRPSASVIKALPLESTIVVPWSATFRVGQLSTDESLDPSFQQKTKKGHHQLSS
jgi:hypothetical protein